jgi:hypothetical protein
MRHISHHAAEICGVWKLCWHKQRLTPSKTSVVMDLTWNHHIIINLFRRTRAQITTARTCSFCPLAECGAHMLHLRRLFIAHQIAPRNSCVEICFASANELYDRFRIHADYANPAVHSSQANVNIVTHPARYSLFAGISLWLEISLTKCQLTIPIPLNTIHGFKI